jgi:hypothetical protein
MARAAPHRGGQRPCPRRRSVRRLGVALDVSMAHFSPPFCHPADRAHHAGRARGLRARGPGRSGFERRRIHRTGWAAVAGVRRADPADRRERSRGPPPRWAGWRARRRHLASGHAPGAHARRDVHRRARRVHGERRGCSSARRRRSQAAQGRLRVVPRACPVPRRCRVSGQRSTALGPPARRRPVVRRALSRRRRGASAGIPGRGRARAPAPTGGGCSAWRSQRVICTPGCNGPSRR